MNATRKTGGKTPAGPTTADELLALIATQITPALTKLNAAARIAEKAYRTNASLRTGFADRNATEDGLTSLLCRSTFRTVRAPDAEFAAVIRRALAAGTRLPRDLRADLTHEFVDHAGAPATAFAAASTITSPNIAILAPDCI